jgi:hypothetical protein
MLEKKLRLVENGKVLYVPTLDDYDVCREMRVPLTKISQNMLPLLKARCKKNKVKLKVYDFATVEEIKHNKIKNKWPYGFAVNGNTIQIEVPKKKKPFENAKSLVEAVRGFYGRNLFDVEVSSRKFATKIRITIEKSFNEQREPGFK